MSIHPLWLRLLVGALVALPLLCVVLLSFPAWVSWPFLPTDRRQTVLSFVDRLTKWAKAISGGSR
ncbi:hypothetical protein [Microbispora sp. H10830]|uniref:hypothetical protein n=1 Tax=Microbispora sp. H10830 TaxID=2729109 RepID=UPI001600921D|nr:hypothetical protein [Microbispora sp. H10830]